MASKNSTISVQLFIMLILCTMIYTYILQVESLTIPTISSLYNNNPYRVTTMQFRGPNVPNVGNTPSFPSAPSGIPTAPGTNLGSTATAPVTSTTSSPTPTTFNNNNNNNVSNDSNITGSTTTGSTKCDYNDKKLGCTTCQNVVNMVKNNIHTTLLKSQHGCKYDYECSLQSISTLCGQQCLQPILTTQSQPIAEAIMMMNVDFCENETFQTQCSNVITSIFSPGTTGNSNVSRNNMINCIEQESFCDLSTSKCSQRNKLVAAATEVFATPVSIAGIGSNPNGIDNIYREPGTNVVIATSIVPIPTNDNVSNVISNIPLPPGVLPPPGVGNNSSS